MSGRRYHAGLSAEDQVARDYEERGGNVLERRWRSTGGEIDLIVDLHGILVFVEVKARRHLDGDSPISPRQWARLTAAAQIYLAGLPGAHRPCRFDAALLTADGGLHIIENAGLI